MIIGVVKKRKFKPEAWLPVKLANGQLGVIPLKSSDTKSVAAAKSLLLADRAMVGPASKTQAQARKYLVSSFGASAEQAKVATIIRMGWWHVRGDFEE